MSAHDAAGFAAGREYGDVLAMAEPSLVETFVLRLLHVESFDRAEVLEGISNVGGRAELALWKAQELLVERFGKRFVKAKEPGHYIVGTADQRTKRVQKRRRAAGRVMSRQLKEVHRLLQHAANLASSVVRTLTNEEVKLSDASVRSRIAERKAEKKKPAGI